MNEHKVKFGAIYSGAGAPLLAAKWANMEVKWGIEPRTKTFNIKTHRINFQRIMWADQIKAFFNEPVDVIWGSPSCGEFSSAGRSSRNKVKVETKEFDEFEYTQFVQEIITRKPPIFILENLPSIRNFLGFEATSGGYVLKNLISKQQINLPDYYIEEHILSPIDVGFPQERIRLFTIGSLFPYRFFFQPPEKTPDKTTLTIRHIFEDLDKRRLNGETLYNDRFPKHSADKIEKMKRLNPGEGFYGGMQHRRLDPDKPSPVIMSSSTKFIHPWENRTLTVRESACLMGYPIDFQFFGSENKCLDQVGKSICPQVGEFILKQVYEYLLWEKEKRSS